MKPTQVHPTGRLGSSGPWPLKLHHWPALLAALILSSASSMAAAAHSLAEQISQQFIFHQAIVWIGHQPPPDSESELLWGALQQFRAGGSHAGLNALEEFVARFPDSAWTPSIRSNLAEVYREQGRLTPALHHWEMAWQKTQPFTEGTGKDVADFTLAHWTRLLASLGRKEQLLDLLSHQGKGRLPSRGAWVQLLSRTTAGLNTMLHSPGMSYRCGSLALYNVALALKGPGFNAKTLLDTPSPETGFSLAALADLSSQLGLDVIAMQRPANDSSLVVPSVVHWRQGHYAAITRQHQHLFRVVDPTFGRARLFDGQPINSEASGYFLVPADQAPDSWRRLDPAEAAQVFGRGFPADLNDEEDEPCQTEYLDPAQPTVFPESQSARIGNDGSNGSDCDSCGPSSGLATWRVSEPFITLWLEDEPLGYQPSRGPRLSLRLFYKQRETRPESPYIYGLGDLWNSSFISYLKVLDQDSARDGKPLYSYYEATLYLPGGGERYYTHIDEQEGWRENRQFTRLERIADANNQTVGFRLLHPRGSQDLYRYLKTSGVHLYAHLTERIDRYGHRTRFHYTESIGQTLLSSIEDVDGQFTTFNYSGNRIVQINAPDGRTALLSYNSYNRLSSIRDAMGIVSSFAYSSAWITELNTPYGTTRFDHYLADLIARTNPNTGQIEWIETGGGYRINRALTITQPDGANQLYVYREQSARLNNQTDSPAFLPRSYSPAPVVPNVTFENDLMDTQNSFHWNSRQYAALSTTVLANLSVADYAKARLKHWIRMPNTPFHSVGGVPDLIREPSPDSNGLTPGPLTWLQYPPGNLSYGTVYAPAVIARVLPDGATQYLQIERNLLGLPTRITSNATVHGQPATRFTDFIYAPNQVDLLEVRTPGPFQSYQPTDLFEFNSQHQVTRHQRTVRFIDPANRLTESDLYSYDPFGRLTSLTRANGLTTYFTYGFNGRISRLEDAPIGRVNTFSYFANGLPYSHTDERGLTRWFSWDNLQRLASVSFSTGGSIQFRYGLDSELRPGGGFNILQPTSIGSSNGPPPELARRTSSIPFTDLRLTSVRSANGPLMPTTWPIGASPLPIHKTNRLTSISMPRVI